MNANILIFGDSIVWGAWDEQGGWAERLRRSVTEKTIASNYQDDVNIYNLGIPGNTSEDVLARFESESKVRINPEYLTIFLIAVGINDSQINLSDKSNKVTPEKYKENIQKIINLSKQFSSKLYLVGITPVDQRVAQMEWKPGFGYLNSEIEKYNQALFDISKDSNCGFLDVYTAFADYGKELLEDGLHPNLEGHRVIFEVVSEIAIG